MRLTTYPRNTIPRLLLAAVILGAVVSPVPVLGQTLSKEKRLALAEQAALADGYRRLRLEVLALPMEGGRSLGDLSGDSASMAIGIRRLVAQAERNGLVRRYSSGDAEVELRLSLASFVDGLKKLHAAAGAEASVKGADLDALGKTVGQRVLVATGHGLAPTEDELTGPPGWPGGQAVGDLPPAGWANVTGAGYRAAQRAAQLDAIDHLSRQITQLKMERAGSVAALVSAAPSVGRGLRQSFDGLRMTKPEFLPEQVCRLYVEADVTDVVARLRQLYAALDPKPNVTESDLASIVRLASVRRLRAAGYGLPPSSTLRKDPYAVVDLDEPDWAKDTLRASSKASPPADGSAAARAIEVATQDARIAAQLKLAEQVDLLALPGGVTVGAFLDHHEALAGDVLTFLSTARAAGPPKVDEDRRVTLELELPLRRLWLILRPAIPTTEVRTSPPAKP